MATFSLVPGVNQVIYTGSTPLTIGTAPFTAANVRVIYRNSANDQGYISNTLAGNQAAQPFRQLARAAAGAKPQGYIIIALKAFDVDAALFGLVTIPDDTFTTTLPAGGQLRTETYTNYLSARARTLRQNALPAAVSLVEYRLGTGAYGTLAALQTAINAQPDSDFAPNGPGSAVQLRITRSSLTPASLSYTASY